MPTHPLDALLTRLGAQRLTLGDVQHGPTPTLLISVSPHRRPEAKEVTLKNTGNLVSTEEISTFVLVIGGETVKLHAEELQPADAFGLVPCACRPPGSRWPLFSIPLLLSEAALRHSQQIGQEAQRLVLTGHRQVCQSVVTHFRSLLN